MPRAGACTLYPGNSRIEGPSITTRMASVAEILESEGAPERTEGGYALWSRGSQTTGLQCRDQPRRPRTGPPNPSLPTTPETTGETTEETSPPLAIDPASDDPRSGVRLSARLGCGSPRGRRRPDCTTEQAQQPSRRPGGRGRPKPAG